jgi:hypothetical protein
VARTTSAFLEALEDVVVLAVFKCAEVCSWDDGQLGESKAGIKDDEGGDQLHDKKFRLGNR